MIFGVQASIGWTHAKDTFLQFLVRRGRGVFSWGFTRRRVFFRRFNRSAHLSERELHRARNGKEGLVKGKDKGTGSHQDHAELVAAARLLPLLSPTSLSPQIAASTGPHSSNRAGLVRTSFDAAPV